MYGHYNEVAEELSCGFTPDASYPCIHGEKGMLGMLVTLRIQRLFNGGFVFNAVCDACTAEIPAEED